MLKIRLQGTKNDIRWFVRLLQRDKRFEVNNVSTFFDNVGTDKYKRVYAEVSRKKRILVRNQVTLCRQKKNVTMWEVAW